MQSLNGIYRAKICTREAEAQIVVPVVGVVVVAIRRPAVLGIVVPAATPVDPVGACLRS